MRWAIQFVGDRFLTFGSFNSPEIASWWGLAESDGEPFSVVRISA